MNTPRFMRARGWTRRITRVALTAAVSLVLAEAALRASGRYYLGLAEPADPPAAPGDIVVLCLGESSTYGLWLPRRESYPGGER